MAFLTQRLMMIFLSDSTFTQCGLMLWPIPWKCLKAAGVFLWQKKFLVSNFALSWGIFYTKCLRQSRWKTFLVTLILWLFQSPFVDKETRGNLSIRYHLARPLLNLLINLKARISTFSCPEWMIESCKIVFCFKSADEILHVFGRQRSKWPELIPVSIAWST